MALQIDAVEGYAYRYSQGCHRELYARALENYCWCYLCHCCSPRGRSAAAHCGGSAIGTPGVTPSRSTSGALLLVGRMYQLPWEGRQTA